jgi:hypothetical protein
MQQSLGSITFNNRLDNSIQQAQKHCNITWLGQQYKMLLMPDSYSAHPAEETFTKDNVFVVHLPPNHTVLLPHKAY